MKDGVIWSKKYPGQHDGLCLCDACESYRRNEAAWITRREQEGEFVNGCVVTGMDLPSASPVYGGCKGMVVLVAHACGAILEESSLVGYAGATDDSVYEEIRFYHNSACVEICPGCGLVLDDRDCRLFEEMD